MRLLSKRSAVQRDAARNADVSGPAKALLVALHSANFEIFDAVCPHPDGMTTVIRSTGLARPAEFTASLDADGLLLRLVSHAVSIRDGEAADNYGLLQYGIRGFRELAAEFFIRWPSARFPCGDRALDGECARRGVTPETFRRVAETYLVQPGVSGEGF